MSTFHPERRQFGRRESTLHAVALIAGRAPAHCIVRNYSERGALLEFQERIEPPFRFKLQIEAKGVELACEVRHQGRHGVGVLFTGGATEALFEHAKAVSCPTHMVPRPAAPVVPKASGTELRTALFGPKEKAAEPEPVRILENGSVGIIRGVRGV